MGDNSAHNEILLIGRLNVDKGYGIIIIIIITINR